MYKYILQSIHHINWFAVIALLLFLAVFVYGSWWAISRRRDFIEDMSRLPLEEDNHAG
ncbi:MAG: hypothetical protein RLY31_3145 [Bacteroidota bacterium]|jgi:hypothetical protein